MQVIEPWMLGPFELLRHAEGHFKQGDESDLRIALINYDNAIETSITTFIELEPEQRRDLELPKDLLPGWRKRGYHYKLDFLRWYVPELYLEHKVKETELQHIHKRRNDLYHGSAYNVPARRDVLLAQKAAKWVFFILYYIDADSALVGDISTPDVGKLPPDPTAQERQAESYLQDSYQVALDILLLILPRYFAVDDDAAGVLSLIEAWQIVSRKLPDVGHKYARLVRQVQDAYDHILQGESTGLSPDSLRSLSDQIDAAYMEAEHVAMDAGLGG